MVYPALDLHVLLSKREGFGISTVEAMSCAVAVVGTDVPGTRDILAGTEAGVLVPPLNEKHTADTIIGLLQDDERRSAMGYAGRKLAMAKYSKERWTDSVGRFYRSIELGREETHR